VRAIASKASKASVLVLALLMLACTKEPHSHPVTCANPVAGCRLDNAISVRFSKTPTIMEKFSLDVESPQGVQPYASFQMQGMDMGLNRYKLIWDGIRWHADVMLPACIRGRQDWMLQLEIGEQVYEVPFISAS